MRPQAVGFEKKVAVERDAAVRLRVHLGHPTADAVSATFLAGTKSQPSTVFFRNEARVPGRIAVMNPSEQQQRFCRISRGLTMPARWKVLLVSPAARECFAALPQNFAGRSAGVERVQKRDGETRRL